jgi:hypothetical protein
VPRPATIRLAEIWAPAAIGQFHRREYAFDLIDYPRNRRRAFHGHDPDPFAREFGVLVHEHCEENLGAPDCSHYFGLPMDGFQAIDEFTRLWSQPADLGCAGLPCSSACGFEDAKADGLDDARYVLGERQAVQKHTFPAW